MAEAVTKGDDPEAIAEAKEIVWRKIMESATPEQRAQYYAMSDAERAELIVAATGSFADEASDGDPQEGP
jgi:hypothetical protein